MWLAAQRLTLAVAGRNNLRSCDCACTLVIHNNDAIRGGFAFRHLERRAKQRQSQKAGLCWAATIVIPDCLLEFLSAPKAVLQFHDHEHSQTL